MSGDRCRGPLSQLVLRPPTCLLFLLCLVLLSLSGCSGEDDLQRGSRLLLDEATLLSEISESIETYLTRIRANYGIEVVIVTLPSIGPDETLKEASSRLFTQWHVGRDYNGQGLLLVLTWRGQGGHGSPDRSPGSAKVWLSIERLEADHELLARLASTTGGALWSPDSLEGLPRQLQMAAESDEERRQFDLWDHPLTFALFVMIGSAEWFLRRRHGLL